MFNETVLCGNTNYCDYSIILNKQDADIWMSDIFVKNIKEKKAFKSFIQKHG